MPLLLKLTDHECVVLGFHPSETYQMDPDKQATIASLVAKCNCHRPQPLTDDELDYMIWVARYLPTSGEADPPHVATCTRIRKKVEALEEQRDEERAAK